MADYQLHEGDCLEILPTLSRGAITFAFADLPYAVTRCTWDVLVPQARFWQSLTPTLSLTGAVAATADVRLAADLVRSCPVPYRYDLVLAKSRPVGFLNSRRMPLRAHELLLYFAQRGATYNVQMQVSHAKRSASTFSRKKNIDCYGKADAIIPYTYGETRYPTSVLRPASPASERGLHPTQKPVALLEWLIATYTNPGDTVLDPCMGSGTTGVACANLGRRFVGIEKDPSYFAVAKKRIEEAHVAVAMTPAQGKLAV